MGDEEAQYAALRERVKELTCLYSLAQLAERPGTTLEEILQRKQRKGTGYFSG